MTRKSGWVVIDLQAAIREGYTCRMFTKTKHAEVVMAARGIKDEWITYALKNPAKTHDDPNDPALQHHLAPIAGFDFRVLRVVTKRGTIPSLVITAYFDRTVKGKL